MIAALFIASVALLAGGLAYRVLVHLRLRRWVDGALDAESAHDRRWTAIRVREAILKSRRWA